MESQDNLLCSLCLCPLWDRSNKGIGDNVKEILDVIFMNKNWWMNKHQTICELCSRRIQDNFNFKCTCIYTEDFLIPFASGIGEPQIDLCQIYKREIIKSDTDMFDCQKVCRLCLQIVNGDATSLLGNTELDMIQKYLPEIMIHNTSDPVACESCTKHLHNFATFIIDCLNVQGKKNRDYGIDAMCIKKKEFSIKEEYKEKSEKSEGCGLVVVKSENQDREGNQSFSDCNFWRAGDAAEMGQYYSKSPYLLPAASPDPADVKNIIELTPPTIQYDHKENYRDATPDDDDKSRVLYDLDLHTLKTEKEEPETKANEPETTKHRTKLKQYDCQVCEYRTKYANAIKSHMLVHAHPSEVKFYGCAKCEYRTKYRNALKSHELKHKLPSEIAMRKCEECPYETKHRTALVLHMLKHRKLSEITMYKCSKCKFQTRFKHALKPHMAKHGDGN